MSISIRNLIITFNSTEWMEHSISVKSIESISITGIEAQYHKHIGRNRLDEKLVAHNIEIKFNPEAEKEFQRNYDTECFSLFERLRAKDIRKISFVAYDSKTLEKLDIKEIFPVWHENNFDTYENKYQSVEKDVEGNITFKITDKKG